MKVESLGAPPPALSETSASTTGPPSIAKRTFQRLVDIEEPWAASPPAWPRALR